MAQSLGTYLGKGDKVAVEGRLQTRSWDDDRPYDAHEARPGLS
jgi:single-stranded DNA-binding protein